MKETNMEHFRGEIEAIMKDFEGFGVDIDNSKLIACKSENCERCKFSYLNNKNKEDPCTKHKIKWLMSECKPEPVLTQREKHFVEFAQEGWLARDSYGELWWHKAKPEKGENCWRNGIVTCGFSGILVFDQHFRFITWEDEEPWSIEDLRKLKGKGGVADD